MYTTDGTLIGISLTVFYSLLTARLILEYYMLLYVLIIKVIRKALP